jgi:glycerol-3-phosphate dehydrogenase
MIGKPHAIIIGAGFTGCAVAYDLMLRGFRCTVVERGEIASGTSGRTHGLLHSGARYCVTDQEAGIECIEENLILRKIANQCIESNGGLFVALDDNDLACCNEFEEGAQACHIPIVKLQPNQALNLEPSLNPALLAAYTVPDGTFDPLRLALAFAASARLLGAEFLPYHEVEGLLINGAGNVGGVRIWDRTGNIHKSIEGDMVINATGAWAGIIAEMADAQVAVIPTPGVMVAYNQRITQRVINRLNRPGDGDIIIPQRRMMIVGTTSFEVKNPDYIPIDDGQVEQMKTSALQLLPGLGKAQIRGVYMSARPLIGQAIEGRSLSRTFECFDHQVNDGIGGFVTITGGKATTCRAMAEKTADLVCKKLGIQAACQTKEIPLKSYRTYYRNQE